MILVTELHSCMIPNFRGYTDTNCGLQCVMAPGSSV